MKKLFPPKLNKGDKVRIIAPSQSMAIISQETRDIAKKRFKELGLKLSFGKHTEEIDEFVSSSIESRLKDLHDAFRNPEIKAIFTAIGGFNSNQLLRFIDWDLIKNNPKIFCGFSDISALNNAIYAKTGLVSYSGPHYSTFGQELYFDYTLDYVKKCFFSSESFEILPSENWTDDTWWEDQKNRNPILNSGRLLINKGKAEGTIFGAHFSALNPLQGTEYFPDIKNSILFIEDGAESQPHHFDRNLQSLLHQAEFRNIKGIVIGRFQKASQMTDEKLIKIIKTKRELNNIPVIANVDFGHTSPMITYPIGGTAKISAEAGNLRIEIIEH